MARHNIDNSEDEDFIYITLHREYWYLTQLAGVFPDLRKGVRKYISIVHLILMSLSAAYALIICSSTVVLIAEDILIASQALHFDCLQIICISILLTACKSRRKFADVHRVIGIGPVEYDEETKNGMKGIKERMRIRKKYLLISISIYMTFAGFLTAILGPFIDSLMRGGIKKDIYSPRGVSLNLPLPLWSPFGSHTNLGYILSITMEMVCACEITVIVVAGDVTFLVMTQYLTMELLLLTLALKRLPDRTIRLYKSRYNVEPNQIINISELRENEDLRKCYAYCLRESAVHHQKIIKAFAGINKLLSLPVFITYFSGSIVIAISGIAMILNEKFIMALYSTKWYYTSKVEARTLQIMMTRSQRPLTLYGGGIVPLNFETFSNMNNNESSCVRGYINYNKLITGLDSSFRPSSAQHPTQNPY
ncbi:hypothetical protein O3M35_000791 [Rhynocoris fuscipes]|uniref:Odorant receptor n=1 Tax=Rhynocoris fuscipes TaxID=488301 RepID=A0AAW1DMZ8_9HEMI